MSDEAKPARKRGASKVYVRVEVTDKLEGQYSSSDVAEVTVSETVQLADEGPRHDPALTTVRALADEAVRKATAQVVAYDQLEEAREL